MLSVDHIINPRSSQSFSLRACFITQLIVVWWVVEWWPSGYSMTISGIATSGAGQTQPFDRLRSI